MNAIAKKTNQPKIIIAVLALAALAIALVAVSMAGGAQAQTADNDYADPQPCGPSADTAFQPEPHEVSEGHFALFDSYWERTNQNPSQGILRTNECPPLMVTSKKEEFGKVIVTNTRNASGIDIDEVIIHVLETHQATVVATNAEVTEDGGQLSLEEYPEVRRALGLGEDDPVVAGTQVWWLRLDDPGTTDKDETSDLGLGFSAALFDGQYWQREDNEGNPLKAMRYMFEAERYPGSDPADVPHFYVYEAPDIRAVAPDTGVKLVWDSTKVHYPGQAMDMDPGEYRPMQWIFTKEGTYEVSVNFEGFVRKNNPHQSGDSKYDAWERISSNDTETTGENTYTIQVGALAETEPPMFGVSRRAHEDAAGGDHVGEPIQVFNAEVPDLTYTLSGDGHADFSVNARTHPDAAQIVVASGVNLNYSSQSSYDLALEVSDGKDHEGNDDDSVDHTIGVKIDVIQQAHVILGATSNTPTTGGSVALSVNVLSLPEGVAYTDLSYTIWETTGTGAFVSAIIPTHYSDSPIGTTTVSHSQAGTYKYTPEARYTFNGVEHTLQGDPLTITWRDASP